MKLFNMIAISMTSSLLVACGGGGGSSSAETPTPVVTPPAPTPVVVTPPVVIPEVTPDPNAVYDTTAELVVAKSFSMEQEYELTVSFNNTDNRTTYLSVCSDFSEVQNKIVVNYNSCLVRTSVDSQYKDVLNVANNQTRLVMAIWYLDDVKNPRFEVWENNKTENSMKTFIVN